MLEKYRLRAVGGDIIQLCAVQGSFPKGYGRCEKPPGTQSCRYSGGSRLSVRIFGVVQRRDQGAHGKTLNSGTLMAEMPDGTISEEVCDSPKKLTRQKRQGQMGSTQ